MTPIGVVLLSGGLDSATTLAAARADGYDVHALTIRYGQRHAHEIEAAARVARAFGVRRHITLDLDLRAFGGSALTSDIAVPKARSEAEREREIPVTYVPARNTIFLSLALAWAETLRARDIFIGVNAIDYSGYPDCRPEYLDAFGALAQLATRFGVEHEEGIRIHAPLLHLSKREIIALGARLGVDFALTTSCYDPAPEGAACGACDACVIRREGFTANGWVDPVAYVPG